MGFYNFLIVFALFLSLISTLSICFAVLYQLFKSGLNEKVREEFKNRVELWDTPEALRFAKKFKK